MYISSPSSNNKAEVTTSNELKTSGLAIDLAHYESDFNNSVFTITHKVATPDTSSNNILLLTNTNVDTNNRIVINSLHLGSEANTEWEIYTGTTRAGSGSSLTPVNTNTTSNLSLKATVYGSDVANFITLGGSKYYFSRVVSPAWNTLLIPSLEFQILGYGQSLGISAKTAIAANLYITLVVISHKIG